MKLWAVRALATPLLVDGRYLSLLPIFRSDFECHKQSYFLYYGVGVLANTTSIKSVSRYGTVSCNGGSSSKLTFLQFVARWQ